MVVYDTTLTIRQLVEIENALCNGYDVTSFSQLTYDETDDGDTVESFLQFLDKYHSLIDQRKELSFYEETAAIDDQEEIQAYIEQLHVVSTIDATEEGSAQHTTVTHGHINSDQYYISSEKLSTIERAVKHKFGRPIGSRKAKQIIRKAKRKYKKLKPTILR